MNISKIVKSLLQQIINKIIEQVNEELDGKEKKTSVDNAVSIWLVENIAGLGVIQKFVITQYVIPTIPIITQAIYDCLKKKVEGLTENGKI